MDTFSQDKEGDEMQSYTGSHGDSIGDEENEDTPRTAGVIGEWGTINQKLRHHGFQPVMVLPSNQLQHIPGGAVVLDDFTSKNLRHTLDKLISDCDRHQSMVQQLISSSHRIQKDAEEERNRASNHEMEMKILQRELDEERVKNQEMERMRLKELQSHGKEISELKRSKSELVALFKQLEHTVAEKDLEIRRLHQQYKDLIQMEEKKFEKQKHLKKNATDQKSLDNIDNSESSVGKIDHAFDHLKKRNGSPGISSSDFEPVITQSENSTTISAGSGCTPTPLVRGIEKERTKIETKASSGSQMMEWNAMEHKYLIDNIDFQPIDVCRKYLKLIKDVMDVVFSEDSPRFADEVMSQSEHEVHCERAWRNLLPELRMWLRELSGLKDLQTSLQQLCLHLMPWKSESSFKQDRLITVESIKRVVDGLAHQERASPSEIRTLGEPSGDHMKSILAHFQKLFDVNSIEGIFPRMNEVYMYLGESHNLLNNLRDILGLEPLCKSSDVVNAVAKLSKAKHLLDVEDLPGIIKRLDQYDEFFPAFQTLVSELKRILRVQEMDEILTAVTALVKFPHY
ncbi:centrosomal protein of 70 kDa-like isoform X4 [Acropora millepora]|uniref:centrosomal protein of 70 kDa-like isoform X4 n=1 Tax=Acropora millepora TaxID=45264 RepID=UPI001CF278DD|nr:centrosomal protein of 70 kDa-like isoform X4 [Acropora millepora]